MKKRKREQGDLKNKDMYMQLVSEQIKSFWVSGYKSIKEKQCIEIKPLTILAGANSSGKSSIFQPLLLLKQTLESGFDAGPLLLNGPILKLTEFEKIMFSNSGALTNSFSVGFISEENEIEVKYKKEEKEKTIVIEHVKTVNKKSPEESYIITPTMKSEEIKKSITQVKMLDRALRAIEKDGDDLEWEIKRDKCFLKVVLKRSPNRMFPDLALSDTTAIANQIKSIIYLPGLRSTPERTYPITSIENINVFEGKFEKYIASIIAYWSSSGEVDKIKTINNYLARLGLTATVKAKKLDDTQVEILVNRYLNGNQEDMVNIADVGLGVSQILPLLVALIVAKKGQIIYIEQPEIHLHPKAHIALAEIIAEVVGSGKRVVLETHSELLLRQIQTFIAGGRINYENVKLHWFERDDDGITVVTSANVDENGCFGDWPQDFAEISLKAESDYLNAVEDKLFM